MKNVFARLSKDRRPYIWSCVDVGGVSPGDDWMWRLRGEGDRDAEIGLDAFRANDHWRDWGKHRGIALATRAWFRRGKEERSTWAGLVCEWHVADRAEFSGDHFPFQGIRTEAVFSSPAPNLFIWEMKLRNLLAKSERIDFHLQILPFYPEKIVPRPKPHSLHFERGEHKFFVGWKGARFAQGALFSRYVLKNELTIRVVFCAGRKASLRKFHWGLKADLIRQRPIIERYFRSVPDISTGNRNWDRLFVKVFDDKRLNLIRMPDRTIIECPDRPAHSSQWIWDSCFHALTWPIVGRGDLAVKMLLRLLRIQNSASGFIPMWESPICKIAQSQPPLISWALVEIEAKKEDLRWAYPRLCKFHEWWWNERAAGASGLCGWQTRQESGNDNSPRFDNLGVGVKYASIDLNCQLLLDAECLAKIAHRIGKDTHIAHWQAWRERIRQRIREFLWHPRDAFFYDRSPEGEFVRIKTFAGFWALISEAATRAQVRGLVKHLLNEKEFASPYPVPSVAMDEKTFSSGNGWRGPTWVCMNYVIIRGLENYGFLSEATELARQTIDLVSTDYIRTGYLWECYDSVTGTGETTGQENLGRRTCNPCYCGWDGLVADLMCRYFSAPCAGRR